MSKSITRVIPHVMDSQSDPRFLKGIEIALKQGGARRIQFMDGMVLWKVQSGTKAEYSYEVIQLPNDYFECNCPDFVQRNQICKHIYAVLVKFCILKIQDAKAIPYRVSTTSMGPEEESNL